MNTGYLGWNPRGVATSRVPSQRYVNHTSKPVCQTHLMVIVSRNERPPEFCSTPRLPFTRFPEIRQDSAACVSLSSDQLVKEQPARRQSEGEATAPPLTNQTALIPDRSGRSPTCFECLSPRREAKRQSASPMSGINRNPPRLSTPFRKNIISVEMQGLRTAFGSVSAVPST